MVWVQDITKTHLFKIASDNAGGYDATDNSFVAASNTSTDSEDTFSTDDLDLDNIVKQDDGVSGYDLVLDSDDTRVNVVVDMSGSMSWNDKDDRRFDLVERLVNRAESCYDGSIRYNLIKFGAERMKDRKSVV